MRARESHTSALPSGLYTYNGHDFERVGPAKSLTRYHGTILPEGELITEFRPGAAELWTQDRPEIGSVPAVYTTETYEEALARAELTEEQEEDGVSQGQVYEVTVMPNRMVDLRDCKDRTAAERAIVEGFDVIECPKHWEQPETIVFDPQRITVENVYSTEPGNYGPVEGELLYERPKQEDESQSLSQYGMSSGYDDDDDDDYDDYDGNDDDDDDDDDDGDRMDSIREAVTDYHKERQSSSSNAGSPDHSIEYRSPSPSQQPAYTPRGGRGTMRY